MLKINPHFYYYFYLIYSCFLYEATSGYNPYDNNKRHHLLQTTNSANDGYNAQQSAFNENTDFQQNLQGNSNYQQMYRYFYTPPYQQQQPPMQSHQSTQLWSGPPIVVEDDIQQQQQSLTNIPPTFYQQHSSGNIRSSSESLPFLYRNSKVLTPTVYNPQPTTTPSTQAYFNNNNNNNIIYHRDFRHHINAIANTPQHTQQESNMISWNNQQQQHQLLEQQPMQQQSKPPDFYTSATNLRHNGILNDVPVASFRKVNVPHYTDHFKRYLENNPRRIKPIL